MEIERKYAVKQLPENLDKYHCKVIEQGYLCHNPIVRIRKSNEDYILTYKSSKGIEAYTKEGAIRNQEVELPLSQEAYETLKNKTENHMVYKKRYLIPMENGLIAELDIFEGMLTGLVMVEVEFPDSDSADSFVPPDWFGKHLSEDKHYSNYHLSKLSSYQELNS